jgi:hypothetical protein
MPASRQTAEDAMGNCYDRHVSDQGIRSTQIKKENVAIRKGKSPSKHADQVVPPGLEKPLRAKNAHGGKERTKK